MWWLAADGDERLATDHAVTSGFACDADGCVARLAGGAAVAVTRTAAAIADDCARAALMVTLRVVPSDCAATVIDRKALRSGGATSLIYRNGVFERTSARPEGQDRPWARAWTPGRPAPRPAAPGTP